MPFTWATTPRPIVALAPMAGVTDAPFRRMLKGIAPDVLLYSEFVSTNALSFGSGKTMAMLVFDPEVERPLIVQVFGADPKKFLEACTIIEQLGVDGIDINMGCPAGKIISSCYGAALIQKPELAAELVASAVRAVSVPVSVKTRLGWESADTLIPFCKRLIEAGVSALAVHGRTYRDKFSGKANWEPIYALKREVSVPVIGNGDIVSAADAVSKIGNLDGVMVGRGAIGNPWLMHDICYALRVSIRGRSCPTARSIVLPFNKKSLSTSGAECFPRLASTESSVPAVHSLSFQEKIPIILEHCELAVRLKGERRGILEMRRHLLQYIRGFDGAKELRTRLMKVERLEEVKRVLEKLFNC